MFSSPLFFSFPSFIPLILILGVLIFVSSFGALKLVLIFGSFKFISGIFSFKLMFELLKPFMSIFGLLMLILPFGILILKFPLINPELL